MTILDLFLIAFLFLLVGGWTRAAEQMRELLDFLRPPQPEPPPPPAPRPFHVPPPADQPEAPMANGATMPPPPMPDFEDQLERDYQAWLHRQNPDTKVKDTDKDLGGVASHIPPSLTGEEPEEE